MKLFATIAVLFLIGCEASPRDKALYYGKPIEVCHRGVTYLQFESGVTTMWDLNSHVVPCQVK